MQQAVFFFCFLFFDAVLILVLALNPPLPDIHMKPVSQFKCSVKRFSPSVNRGAVYTIAHLCGEFAILIKLLSRE